MIRVAQVLHEMNMGGVEAVMTDYYRYIDKEKVQFDFYYCEKSTVPMYDELKEMGAGLYPIPSIANAIKYHKTLYKAFKERDYHIVHTQVSSLAFFPLLAAKRAGVRVRIAHSHTVSDPTEGRIKAITKDLLRPLCKLVTTHNFACGDLAGNWMYGKDPFKVIINARELDKFAYSQKAREEIRKEFGIPQDAFVIGNVGRHCPEKNHAFLLEIQKYIPNAYVLLVGKGALTDSLVGDRVVKTGNRRDVNKIYSAMDVFCLPSYSEGLPLVVPEAEINGLRCVISETVTKQCDAKNNAVFLPLKNPEKWAEEIIKCKRDFTPMPEQWDIRHAAKELQQWYIDNNDYVSAYVRNKDVGPACYYRVTQYAQSNWKLNDAYSKKQYQKNFDLPSGVIKKFYQAYLLPIIIFNRKRQLKYDLKYKPKKIIIQRELIPKISFNSTNRMLKKISETSGIIWDFDDDIRLNNECSLREFNLLDDISENIVVTSSYLREMVSHKEKVKLLPTTVKPIEATSNRGNNEKLKVVWVGSWSSLENLDLLEKLPEEVELIVVCNLPYKTGKFIKWSRESADEQLKEADIGIMPLQDKPYNLGKGAFKIIQYMSAGLPVVASPVGFNKEVVTEDFGFLTDDFYNAIKTFCDNRDLCKKMGKMARARYEEKYSYKNNLQEWLKLCE